MLQHSSLPWYLLNWVLHLWQPVVTLLLATKCGPGYTQLIC